MKDLCLLLESKLRMIKLGLELGLGLPNNIWWIGAKQYARSCLGAKIKARLSFGFTPTQHDNGTNGALVMP